MNQLQIKKTVGLRCKACDSHLHELDCDGELCDECLYWSTELNKNLQNKQLDE